MNELIKINYETEQPTVSARDLHEQLNIEKRFSAWFETNSKGFIENEDFTSVLTAVSYTHLDVYKRQILSRSRIIRSS